MVIIALVILIVGLAIGPTTYISYTFDEINDSVWLLWVRIPIGFVLMGSGIVQVIMLSI